MVENECDNDFQGMLDTPNTPNSATAPLQSPSNTSEKGVMIISHNGSTNHEVQATFLIQNNGQQRPGQEQHILNLNMLATERKGAFAVLSPTTAAEVSAVYGDGEGGKVARSGLASVRHSKQDLEIDAKSEDSCINLPRFGYEKVAKTMD